MSYRKNLMPSDITPSEAHKATVVESGTDCISRQMAKDELCKLINVFWQIPHNEAMACIDNLPSVQPERATGYWEPVGMVEAVGGESAMWGTAIAYHRCSECYEQALESNGDEVLSNFCPHCGADMRSTNVHP